MSEIREAKQMDDVGLCRACRNARIVTSAKGNAFYLCELSATDPAFAKYPRLPVLRCAGFVAKAEPKGVEDSDR